MPAAVSMIGRIGYPHAFSVRSTRICKLHSGGMQYLLSG